MRKTSKTLDKGKEIEEHLESISMEAWYRAHLLLAEKTFEENNPDSNSKF